MVQKLLEFLCTLETIPLYHGHIVRFTKLQTRRIDEKRWKDWVSLSVKILMES